MNSTITLSLLFARPAQLPWRPFWDLLLRLHLLPRRSESAIPAQNVSVLADFVSSASRHFEPGAAAAVAALLTPSLSNVQSTAYFTAQVRALRCAFHCSTLSSATAPAPRLIDCPCRRACSCCYPRRRASRTCRPAPPPRGCARGRSLTTARRPTSSGEPSLRASHTPHASAPAPPRSRAPLGPLSRGLRCSRSSSRASSPRSQSPSRARRRARCLAGRRGGGRPMGQPNKPSSPITERAGTASTRGRATRRHARRVEPAPPQARHAPPAPRSCRCSSHAASSSCGWRRGALPHDGGARAPPRRDAHALLPDVRERSAHDAGGRWGLVAACGSFNADLTTNSRPSPLLCP